MSDRSAQKSAEAHTTADAHVHAQAALFPPLSEEKGGHTPLSLDFLNHIPVTLSVEVGATKIRIEDILGLGPGSVVELDRFASEALDVKINGVCVARGEVVIVGDKFGIRLTDVVSSLG